MEFVDLKSQYLEISDSVQRRIQNVLEHGRYIMGPEIKELETSLTDYTGANNCITCASGTDALLMVLMANGVGEGDAVFTTPFTFIATAEVIALLGATPVFVDIDPKTFNMDPENLKEAIENLKRGKKPSQGSPQNLKAKAVIPVDLFGLPSNYDDIEGVAKQNDLFVLADAAQSLGGSYKNRMVGTLGNATATSFFPAKPLGCYGDGGAIFTNDNELANTLRSIRVHGKGSEKYDNVRIGINGRLDTLQAAILLSKLKVFPDEVKQRNKIASTYTKELEGCLQTPYLPMEYSSAWAQYSVMSPGKEKIMSELSKKGIPTMVYYPKPLHLQTAFSRLGYKKGSQPVSEKVSKDIFSLPMHPYLLEKDQEMIVKAIKDLI